MCMTRKSPSGYIGEKRIIQSIRNISSIQHSKSHNTALALLKQASITFESYLAPIVKVIRSQFGSGTRHGVSLGSAAARPSRQNATTATPIGYLRAPNNSYGAAGISWWPPKMGEGLEHKHAFQKHAFQEPAGTSNSVARRDNPAIQLGHLCLQRRGDI